MLKYVMPNQSRNYFQKFFQFDIYALIEEQNLTLRINDNIENVSYLKEFNGLNNKQFHPKMDAEDIFLSVSCTRVRAMNQENNQLPLQDTMSNWLNSFFKYQGKGKITVQSKMLDMRTNKFVYYESKLQLDKQKDMQQQIEQISMEKPPEIHILEKSGNKKEQVPQMKINKSSFEISVQTVKSKNQGNSIHLNEIPPAIFQQEQDPQEKILIDILIQERIQLEQQQDNERKQSKKTKDQQLYKPKMEKYDNYKFAEDLKYQTFSSNFEKNKEKQNPSYKISNHIQEPMLKKKQKMRKFSEQIGKKQKQELYNIEDIISEININFSNDQELTSLIFKNLQNLSPQQKVLKIKEIYGQQEYKQIVDKIRQQYQQEKKYKKMTFQQKRQSVQNLFDTYFIETGQQYDQYDSSESQEMDEQDRQLNEVKNQKLYSEITPDFLKKLKKMLIKRQKKIKAFHKHNKSASDYDGDYIGDEEDDWIQYLRDQYLYAKILKKYNRH